MSVKKQSSKISVVKFRVNEEEEKMVNDLSALLGYDKSKSILYAIKEQLKREQKKIK